MAVGVLMLPGCRQSKATEASPASTATSPEYASPVSPAHDAALRLRAAGKPIPVAWASPWRVDTRTFSDHLYAGLMMKQNGPYEPGLWVSIHCPDSLSAFPVTRCEKMEYLPRSPERPGGGATCDGHSYWLQHAGVRVVLLRDGVATRWLGAPCEGKPNGVPVTLMNVSDG